ncbi:hypothetical protein PRZ48_000011 [Zasmidium cellare]|uniref:Uncharacterized protein n=1 Tax=Zasmidium cellare TaxID=395010 RepID=A0ABR0EXB0_ZASCE|nr:hypothetical protein PRZ48_000011 [Zasmidium cellare]
MKFTPILVATFAVFVSFAAAAPPANLLEQRRDAFTGKPKNTTILADDDGEWTLVLYPTPASKEKGENCGGASQTVKGKGLMSCIKLPIDTYCVDFSLNNEVMGLSCNVKFGKDKCPSKDGNGDGTGISLVDGGPESRTGQNEPDVRFAQVNCNQ